ncbi:hypothetical protein M5X11_28075 [Paenibacillus alginolyticus]|uniref:hypothetical protein n=1 Tax=Paenibacillus alginolyticus TaxID=59839 RepID=UPI0003F9A484|nr:hypothetical protein [Paenibacillus alginolyticus]MCY9668736.1 hypothetical protein [Paenibacillus alginolyticus]
MKNARMKMKSRIKQLIWDRSGLEFWEYMVFAIVMGLVVWAMKPLLLDLFTTIITTLKTWWTSQIGR